MKKILGVIPVLMLLVSLQANAQINFAYDASGNRTKCQLIVQPVPDTAHISNAEQQQKKDVKSTAQQNTLVSVYPNPTSDQLIIDTKQDGPYTIVLYDMQGKVLRQEHGTNAQHQMDLSTCQTGYYFLEVNTGNQKTKWKVLKQ